MRSKTSDRIQARLSGENGEFARELDAWFGDYKIRNHQLYLTQRDLAEQLGVRERQLSAWLSGENLPRRDYCVVIARTFGVEEDYVVHLAGHSTFSQLREVASKHLTIWHDGDYIMSALNKTHERSWKYSTSPWKADALKVLDRWRPRTANEDDTHQIAYQAARFIHAWALDPGRDAPLYQRRVELASA